MTRSRFALLAATSFAAIAMSGLASAADLPYGQPTYAPPVNRVAAAWQGFYVGVHGGYTWGNFSAGLAPGPTAFDVHGSSFSGGLFAGMNFQVAPQFLVGMEGDLSLYNPKSNPLLVGGFLQASSDWQGTVRGRAGVTFDNLFVYGTGGLAIAGVQFTGPLGSQDRTKLGWALGFGAEAKLTENLFARAEYIYTNYGTDTYVLGFGSTVRGDLDTHTVRVGVGYRF